MKDKVVIITGSTSGIGLETAKYFYAQGAKIVISGRNTKVLDTLEQDFDTERCLAFRADVSEKNDCKNLVLKTIHTFGKIDILVNNAGISMRSAFNETDIEVIEKVLAINLLGAIYMTKFALPHILETQGSIVGVSSIAGKVGLPLRTGYSCSKFGLEGFLESLRTENRNNNLHVLTICPGFTQSNIRKTALTKDGSVQAESPRNEKKMMTAQKVAQILYNGVAKRKPHIVLTSEGKLITNINKFFKTFASKLVYNAMRKEEHSGL